jgi:radical SAM superfamily enzyme YgiQ (UPF0313 family)
VVLHDEAVSPVDLDTPCDLVGLTGYVIQRKRMVELAEAFRARGVPVAIGGPFASLSPHHVRSHADILFLGEAELTWPAFLEDFRRGRYESEYKQEGNVDLRDSPVPDFSGLDPDKYFCGAVQTSRGCPFECEFCDVIVLLGRRQRHKDPDRIVKEIAQLHAAGQRQTFLSDDNFTANRRRAADTLSAIAEWNRTASERMTFITQMSIDVARDADVPLLELSVEAGLTNVFVGVESPNEAAMLEVKKRQNVIYDVLEHVHKIQRHGMSVHAGMMVGFDSDDADIFQTQFDFAQAAGTAITSLTMLNAPEGTPLQKRLVAAGRIRSDEYDDGFLSTNITPNQFTHAELLAGTQWLMNKLYDPVAFFERLDGLAERLPDGVSAGQHRGREVGQLWDRISHGFKALGPEFERMPREGARLFARKDFSHLGTALIFYFHIVRLLRHWQVWDPELARAAEPIW